MANRYWVGANGTWNTSSTAVWSASSDGSPGASVPTAADSVFFDQIGTYTVTMTGALLCLDFTVSADTVTFATGTNPTLAVSGSMTLLGETLWTSTGRITFNATTTGKTVTTNGASFACPLTFNGAGGAWTLGGALTTTANVANAIAVTAGTFSTSASNYAVTAVNFNVNGGTVTLNGSTITLIGTAPYTYTSGTVNAGTSQITMTGQPAVFGGGGQTYYNVSNTANSSSSTTITGANTFNNLTTSSINSNKILILSANQTVNGTLTIAGASPIYRNLLRSNIFGTTRTVTSAAISATDGDFQDITLAGAAAGASPTRAGDGKGNSGITFPAAKTVYWNLAVGGLWSATGWAATSGGSPATANFPLAQDTALFEATGLNSGATVTIDSNYFIGTINMAARTSNTMTLGATSSHSVVGNWVNGTGVTLAHNSAVNITFLGRGSQTITSATRSFTCALVVDSPGGTVTLQDALTNALAASDAMVLTNGTLDLNGQTLTSTFLTATGTKNLTFNGGTLTSGRQFVPFNNAAPAGFTTTAGTGTGTIRLTSALAKTFIGGGSTYNCTLDQGGAGTLAIFGSNTFTTLSNSVQPTTINFTAGTTQTLTNWNINGTAGNLVTINSGTASAATLSKAFGTVNANYLSISYLNATGGATWYAGSTSIDGGNNTGWQFINPAGQYNLMFFF